MNATQTIQQLQQREATLTALLQQYLPGFALPAITPAPEPEPAQELTAKQLIQKKKWTAADTMQAVLICEHNNVGIKTLNQFFKKKHL